MLRTGDQYCLIPHWKLMVYQSMLPCLVCTQAVLCQAEI